MNAKDTVCLTNPKVLSRAEPSLAEKYLDPIQVDPHDQVQFEIPVVWVFSTPCVLYVDWDNFSSDLITQDTFEKTALKNPVASNLIEKATDLLDDFENTNNDAATSSNWEYKTVKTVAIQFITQPNLQNAGANKVILTTGRSLFTWLLTVLIRLSTAAAARASRWLRKPR